MLSRILDMIRGKPDSKTIAKDRLKLILIQDRTLVEPDILEMIRDDMMTVLTKYFDFEQSNVEMDLQRENEQLVLWLTILRREIDLLSLLSNLLRREHRLL